MGDLMEDNDPFEEDIVFDQAGLLGGKSTRVRHHHNPTGFLPTFMLFSRTVFLCVAFIGLGLCGSISRGPVIKVQEWLGVTEWEALHTFTAHSIGALLGGVLGSKLFDVYNRQFLVFVSLVWVSVSVSVLPFTLPVSQWWMRTTLVAISAGIAFLFTGGNVLCLDLWGRQGGGASLQALHFSYALGAFIAPIIIHPFFAGQHLHIGNSSITTFVKGSSDGLELVPPLLPVAITTLSTLTTDLNNVPSDVADVIVSNDGKDLVRVPRVRALDIGKRDASLDIRFLKDDEIMNLTLPRNGNTSVSNLGTSGAATSGITPQITVVDSPDSAKKPDWNLISDTVISYSKNVSNSDNLQVGIVADMTANLTKPARPKPSHTGASVKDEDKSVWKKPSPPKPVIASKVDEASGIITSPIPAMNGVDKNIFQSNTSLLASVKPPSNISELGEGDRKTPTLIPAQDALTLSMAKYIENNTAGVSANETIAKAVMTPQPYLISSSVKNAWAKPSLIETSLMSISTVFPSYLSPTPVPVRLPATPRSGAGIQFAQQHYGDTYQQISGGFLSDEAFYQPELSVASSDSIATGSLDSGIKTSSLSSDAFYGDEQMSVTMTEPEVENLKEDVGNKKDSLVRDNTLVEASNVTEKMSKGSVIIHSIVGLLKKPGTFSNITDDVNNKFIETIAQKFKRYGVTKIHLAFICIGIFVFINSLIFVVILCHNPREPRSKQEEGGLDHAPHAQYTLFIVMFSMFMFSAEALEGAIHHLLASSSGDNALSILDKGIDGAALFWGLVCLVRFLCILLSGCIRLKPGKLLGVATFFTTMGTIFLCVGSSGKDDFLWSGIILASLGLAPTLPTSLLWMAQYMHVTHRMCALMIVLTSFGISLTHGGLTHIAANSHLYSYILVCMSLSSLLLLVLSWCVLYTSGVRSVPDNICSSNAAMAGRRVVGVNLTSDPSSDGYELARQHEDDEGMEMSRQLLRHHDDEEQHWSQHRQLRHMHYLDREEAGQSLLVD